MYASPGINLVARRRFRIVKAFFKFKALNKFSFR